MGGVEWTELKLSGPGLARSSHAVAVQQDTLYLFGGEQAAREPVSSALWRLDLTAASASWTETPSTGPGPVPRFGHTMCQLAGKLWLFGGRSGLAIDELLLADLWVFDPVTAVWKEVETKGSPPSPRSFHAMAALGTRLYIFGGCPSGGRAADLFVFDTETAVWSELAVATGVEGRGGASLVAEPGTNSLLLLGGFAGREMGDLHRYSVAGNSWTRLEEELVPARSVSCAASLAGTTVLYGGELEPSARGHAGAGSFTAATLLQAGRAGGAAASAGPPARGWAAATVWRDTTMVVVGGLQVPGNP